MEFRDLVPFASAIVVLLCVQTCRSQTVASCKLGECVDALACPILRPAISLHVLSRSQEIIDIIKQHRCGDKQTRRVCCTDLEADLVGNNLLVSDADANSTLVVVGQLMKQPCGISSGSDLILNGVRAFLFEFPWMALLEFEHSTTKEKEFLCAGSLISDRYVLTAAHCFTTGARLITVRLGEYDTSSDPDCEEFRRSGECAPPVQNHAIEDVIIHQDFKNGLVFHDIALIRLKERAVFGDRILPICLPILKNLKRNFESAKLAGWGLTASGNASEILQKGDVPVLSHEFCMELFPGNFSTSQICAGGRRGEDACRGDSGGPLFARGGSNFYRFVQYGILSAGGMVCGGNNTIPSIYTNVVEYVPWIIKNMKP